MKRNTSGLRRGGPGRKRGVPNKATVEIKELSARLLSDPTYLKNLERRMRAGKLHPAIESLFFFYLFGKPKEKVEVTGGYISLVVSAAQRMAGNTGPGGEIVSARAAELPPAASSTAEVED